MKGVNYGPSQEECYLNPYVPYTSMGTIERLRKVRSCRTGKDVKMSIDKGNLHQRLFFCAGQE